jgi:hypothetical protein
LTGNSGDVWLQSLKIYRKRGRLKEEEGGGVDAEAERELRVSILGLWVPFMSGD